MLLMELAKLHAEHTIYPSSWFITVPSDDVVQGLVPNQKPAYEMYLQKYVSCVDLTKNNVTKGDARSVDLPYIGEQVIANENAKIMLVFMGSLQKENIRSMTVLAHLWNQDVQRNIQQIERFWKMPNYLNVYQHVALLFKPEMIEHTYVTDALRIGNSDGSPNNEKNRTLLEREEALLKPELIITVGGNAKTILGSSKYKKDPKRYIHLNFMRPFHKGTQAESNFRLQAEKVKEALQKIIV